MQDLIMAILLIVGFVVIVLTIKSFTVKVVPRTGIYTDPLFDRSFRKYVIYWKSRMTEARGHGTKEFSYEEVPNYGSQWIQDGLGCIIGL